MLIDLHTHSFPKSDDSFLTPEELVMEAKRVGLDGICLTDHDGFWNPDSVQQLSQQHSFLILPGCEVTTEEGHLLVFGLEKYIFGMHRASFVKKLVDEAKGAIVVAHPYRRNYREEEANMLETYNTMVDRACKNTVYPISNAVEVLNGRGSDKENVFSQEVAKRFRMKGTGGSDAHKLEDVGTFATEFERPVENLQELISEIKNGRFAPVVLKKRQMTHIG